MTKARYDRGVMKGMLIAALVLGAAGCPLPFQFSPSGWPGAASASDPSTPSISASPVLSYTEANGGSGTVANGQTGFTTSDTRVTLATETVGAIVYYTTDGTTPDPRSSSTQLFVPSSPLILAVSNPTVNTAFKTLSVKAVAIGPNMKPSLVTSAGVNLQYPQAAAPVFAITGGGGPTFTSDQTLTLASPTPGAAIYYTVVGGAGPAPRPVPGQADTLLYSGPIAVTGPSNTWTFSAIAVKDQMIDSLTASASYTVAYQGLPAPTFNPAAGTYSNDQAVTITSATGSTIWYMLDGTAPVPGVSQSLPSGASLTLSGSAPSGVVALRAIATQAGMADSPAAQADYTFRAAAPVSSPPGGQYDNFQDVTLVTSTVGAGIWYTTDGTLPVPGGGGSSLAYTGPIRVSVPTVITSIAARNGYQSSPLRTDTYTLQAGPANFTPAGGVYPRPLVVTLGTTTTSANIFYTTDGSIPIPGGGSTQVYSGPIAISSNGVETVVRALARAPGFQDSAVTIGSYIIAEVPPNPLVGSATSSSVALSWGTVPNTSGYELVRDISPAFDVAPVILYTGPATSFTDTSVSPSSAYYYAVKVGYPALGLSEISGAVPGATLDAGGMPLVQNVSTSGLAPTNPPPITPNFWVGTIQPGWVAGGYRYVVWDPDYQNSGNFGIGAYDSAGNLVSQWLISGNRYITSVSKDGNGNIVIVGQYGTTLVPWASIQL